MGGGYFTYWPAHSEINNKEYVALRQNSILLHQKTNKNSLDSDAVKARWTK